MQNHAICLPIMIPFLADLPLLCRILILHHWFYFAHLFLILGLFIIFASSVEIIMASDFSPSSVTSTNSALKCFLTLLGSYSELFRLPTANLLFLNIIFRSQKSFTYFFMI